MAIVTAIHLIACVLLIFIVLLQHGKGADMGATFGGSGGALFGATGADNIFTRMTTGLAVVFMVTSIVLASNAKATGAQEGNLFKDLSASKRVKQSSAEEPSKDNASKSTKEDKSEKEEVKNSKADLQEKSQSENGSNLQNQNELVPELAIDDANPPVVSE